MEWRVQLLGDLRVLSELSEAENGDLRVLHTELDGFLLVSTRFDPAFDAQGVRDVAEGLIAELSGAYFLERRTPLLVKMGNLFQYEDSRRVSAYVFPPAAVMTVSAGSLTIVARDPAGEEEVHHPGDRVLGLVTMAQRDECVRMVLSLLRKGDDGWDTLYKILEVVKENSGCPIAKGWIGKKEEERLRRTANDCSAIGVSARHGVQRHEPTPNPMSLTEAQLLVRKLVDCWIRWKRRSAARHRT